MAYTVPTTRATGDLITAAIYNTDIVDNIAWLGDPPFAIAVLTGSTSAGAWQAATVSSAPLSDGLTVAGTTFTVVRAGIYLVTAHASSGTTAVARGLRIRHSSGTTVSQDGTDTGGRSYSCSNLVNMTATQTLTAEFFSATGSETIAGTMTAIWQRDA